MAELNLNTLEALFGDIDEQKKEKLANQLRGKLKERADTSIMDEAEAPSTGSENFELPTTYDIGKGIKEYITEQIPKNFSNKVDLVKKLYEAGEPIRTGVKDAAVDRVSGAVEDLGKRYDYYANPVKKFVGGITGIDEALPSVTETENAEAHPELSRLYNTLVPNLEGGTIKSNKKFGLDANEAIFGNTPQATDEEANLEALKAKLLSQPTVQPTVQQKVKEATTSTNMTPVDMKDKVKRAMTTRSSSSSSIKMPMESNGIVDTGSTSKDDDMESYYAALEQLVNKPTTETKDYVGGAIAGIGDAFAYGINKDWKPKFDAQDWINNIIKQRQVPIENTKDLTKLKVEAALQQRKLAQADAENAMKKPYYESEARKNDATANFYNSGGKGNDWKEKLDYIEQQALHDAWLSIPLESKSEVDKAEYANIVRIVNDPKSTPAQIANANKRAEALSRVYARAYKRNQSRTDEGSIFSDDKSVTSKRVGD